MYTKIPIPDHATRHLDDAADEIHEGLNTLCIRVATGVRPAFGYAGRVFFESTKISRDTGTAWAEMTGGGGGKPPCTKLVAAVDALNTSGADYTCDGSSDQTTINEAITALGSIGGVVQLTEGTFSLSGSIQMENNVMLQGYGKKTILSIDSDGNYEAIENADQDGTGNSNLMVRNLVIEGNSASRTGNLDGIGFFNVDKFWIYNVTFQNLERDGLVLGTGGGLACNDGYIARCKFSACTQYGIHGTSTVNVTITDNQFLTCDRGISLAGTGPYQVMGNEFDACVSYGVLVYASDHTVISGNIFNGSATCHAIYVYHDAASEMDHCAITANAIRSCLYGIEAANLKYCQIGGNNISLVTNGYGISISIGAGLAIDTNHILGTTGSTGISLTTVTESMISVNISRSNGSDGINLSGCIRCAITANKCISNGGVGILLSANDDNNVVVANFCRLNTGYGITVGNANCDENVVQGNTCLSNTAGQLLDSGTATFIGGDATNNNNLLA